MSERTQQPTPPRPHRIPHERTHHGETVVDPYHWMSEAGSAEVIAHLEAENAYTAKLTEHLVPLTDRLLGELRSRVRETDVTVPALKDGWWYFARTTTGQQYEVYCRVPDAGGRPSPQPGAPLPGEQVLLDGNAEAAERDFFELADLEPDPAGARLAFLFDERGDERYDLVVRDIVGGEVLDDAVRGAGYGLVWSTDGTSVYYTRRDDAWRAHEVWRHTVGTDAALDELITAEPDALFNVGIEVSRDDRWLIITHESRTTAEVWLLDLSDPAARPRIVQPRTSGLDYSVEVDADRILVVHNAARVDFDVAWAPLTTPGRDHWTPVLSADEGERVLGVSAFARFTAVSMRSGGLPVVRILKRTDDGYVPGAPVSAPSDVASVSLGSTPEYTADHLQIVATSFLMPRAVFDLDPATGDLVLVKARDVPGFDPTNYREERLWVTARDGVRVPVSLVRRADVTPDGGNPGLVDGYGAYEISNDPYFSAGRLSLLDRGVVFAVAHVRGGGELGRGWYDQGKLLDKARTFHDFVDVGRWLVESGWVAPDRLGAEGGSAGGLLIGASVNEAPELFRVVHAAVPFVDALTTILDPDLPLTVAEWEEWGNPLADAQVYRTMRGYTPYENITATRYPAVLATTNLNDTRVFVAEPMKWVAALRDTVTNDAADRPILLKVEMGGGHGGHSGRYDAWRQQAFEYAVLLDQLGVA